MIKSKFRDDEHVGDVYCFTVLFAVDGWWNRKKMIKDPSIFLDHYVPQHV